jgi:UDP-N-acetylmuramate--alanine ligase
MVMHVYFSGIGGAGITPMALLAKQAGFDVSGSDKQDSRNLNYLKDHGITDVHVGQSREHIERTHAQKPIDWLVYSSALPLEQPDAPELRFCEEKGIKATKRDQFLSHLVESKNLKMIAVAGTHGKTTTTAMAVWLFKQLGIPISYNVAAKISFGETSQLDPDSEYFIYEADEFDRNFLAFHPHLSIITGIDWDHPDIYPTREIYYNAFREYLGRSEHTVMWNADVARLELLQNQNRLTLNEEDPEIDKKLHLAGRVNRLDAWQVAHAVKQLTGKPLEELLEIMNRFPGVGRRFEQIIPNLITDYAHTVPKIQGALQKAEEVAEGNVVVVYEGLHNTRQHFIKDDLKHLFEGVKKLYIVPSYLAREDPDLPLLKPEDLKQFLDETTQLRAEPAALDDKLRDNIQKHLDDGDLVLCITAGGGGSLNEWLHQQFEA